MTYDIDDTERSIQDFYDDLGEGIYWQQVYEHELEYFTRVAESNPVNNHWYQAKAWLDKESK